MCQDTTNSEETTNSTPRTWTIKADSIAQEYKEQINSQSKTFELKASLIMLFLFLLFWGCMSYRSELSKLKTDLNTLKTKIEEKQGKNSSSFNWPEVVLTDFTLLELEENKLQATKYLKKNQNKKENENKKNLTAIARELEFVKIDLESVTFKNPDSEDNNELKEKNQALEELSQRITKITKNLKYINYDLSRDKDAQLKEVYSALQNRHQTIVDNILPLKKKQLQFSQLQSKKIQIDPSKVFDEKLQLPQEDTSLQYFYLPFVWSVLFLGLMLYHSKVRFSILTLYVGVIRRSVEINEENSRYIDDLKVFLEKNTEELLGTPQCGWWWLEPLPRFEGTQLNATELRAALGWNKAQICRKMLVGTIGLLLIVMQIVVLISSFDMINVFDAENKSSVSETENFHSAFLAIQFSIALASISLVILRLMAIDNVPNFGNQCIKLDRRNLIRLSLALLVAVPLGYRYYKYNQNSPHQFSKPKNPRYRTKGKRNLCIEDTNLKPGFYQNTRIYKNTSTKILHYLTTLNIDQPMRRKNKKRRVSFKTQAEENLYFTKVDDWRHSGGITPRPPRNRIEHIDIKKPEIKKQTEKCKDLVFRDVGGFPMKSIKPIEDNDVLILLKNLNNGVGSKRNWTKSQSKNPRTPKFQSKRFVFAVEQHVLHHLKSSEPINDNIEYACNFLFEAIKLIGPELDAIRLFDLLAALSFRHKKEMFDKLQKKTAEYAKAAPKYVEFSARTKHWSDPNGNWQKRWSSDKSVMIYKEKWANLPM